VIWKRFESRGRLVVACERRLEIDDFRNNDVQREGAPAVAAAENTKNKKLHTPVGHIDELGRFAKTIADFGIPNGRCLFEITSTFGEDQDFVRRWND